MSRPTKAHEVPVHLYEQARDRLLVNAPMLQTGEGAAIALSASEINALESVGLSTRKWHGDVAQDPLMQTIADFMALLETSLTTLQAAEYLKVDASRVRQRLRERSLFGIDYDGEKRLPRFQFERKKVLPGLREVLAALPCGLNPLDVAEWFLLPNPDLETAAGERTMSPREWLLGGLPARTIADLAARFE